MSAQLPTAVAATRRPIRRRLALLGLTATVACSLLGAGTQIASASTAQTAGAATELPMTNSYWFVKSGTSMATVAGHDGDDAVLVTNTSAAPVTAVLNDTVNSVADTTAGATYDLTGWVRTGTAGQSVAVRFMEYKGATYEGQKQSNVWLRDTGWRQVTLSYTARTSGASLDLNALSWSLPVGGWFEVSGLQLSQRGSSTPVVTPPSTTTPPTTSTPPTSTPPTSTPPTSTPPTSTPPTSTPPTSTPPSTTGLPPAVASYHEVWGDDFNGTSLNPQYWSALNLSTYGSGNHELECSMDRPENLQETGGHLAIIARKETTPVKCGNGDTAFPNGRTYTSAFVQTQGKIAFKYGYFEIRAKLPTQALTSQGMWPAFWLRPVTGGTGELDALESIGSSSPTSQEPSIAHQTIWYDYTGRYPKVTHNAVLSTPSSSGYHTYGVDWEPGSITWYVDGQATFTQTDATTPWLDQAFNKPFYIKLNMAIGGTWPGSPNAATQFPAEYDIDYIHVYQRG